MFKIYIQIIIAFFNMLKPIEIIGIIILVIICAILLYKIFQWSIPHIRKLFIGGGHSVVPFNNLAPRSPFTFPTTIADDDQYVTHYIINTKDQVKKNAKGKIYNLFGVDVDPISSGTEMPEVGQLYEEAKSGVVCYDTDINQDSSIALQQIFVPKVQEVKQMIIRVYDQTTPFRTQYYNFVNKSENNPVSFTYDSRVVNISSLRPGFTLPDYEKNLSLVKNRDELSGIDIYDIKNINVYIDNNGYITNINGSPCVRISTDDAKSTKLSRWDLAAHGVKVFYIIGSPGKTDTIQILVPKLKAGEIMTKFCIMADTKNNDGEYIMSYYTFGTLIDRLKL
jgi:hypothetical protein